MLHLVSSPVALAAVRHGFDVHGPSGAPPTDDFRLRLKPMVCAVKGKTFDV